MVVHDESQKSEKDVLKFSGLLTSSQEFIKNDFYEETENPSSCKEVLVCTMCYHQIIIKTTARVMVTGYKANEQHACTS